MKALLGGIGFGLVFLIFWLVLLSTGRQQEATSAQLSTEVSPPTTGLPQLVRAIDLTGPFTFAGQEVPVDNFDVRERLDLELTRNAYFHRNTLLLLKRRTRYFPTIERILAEAGVPDDLKYLAAAESTLTEAVSPAGAKGVWQFMAPTGRAYGLRIDGEVDERFHLEKATRAATLYLKDYYKKFEDWHKVAAAYNMGGPNLSKWLERQRAEAIYDLDINAETMQYVFRIVALKTILEDPESFGYHLEASDTYPSLDDFRTVTVDRSVSNLGDFALAQGTTYRLLKRYNPWLISGSLSVDPDKPVEVRIPTGSN
ncbi:hypothetical protein GGR28_000754 [Lewinella aquimaris]|uniref:Transglycosylase SLT domain-containing protein n=1 Tax=Neolewinella aquimaris TaxID=1835722 RepID=A0A840E2G8_9BACT|nr:lytic transglycosylase domain-containing protein [Neolewinella aquimaris]MBB4078153.1 hypothetical protein [Neolewinella aquimaris]